MLSLHIIHGTESIMFFCTDEHSAKYEHTMYSTVCGVMHPPFLYILLPRSWTFPYFYVILSNIPLTILKAFKISTSFCIHCQESIFKEMKCE